MDLQRYLPWRNRTNKPAPRGEEAQHPIVSLQQAMNSLFDSFWQDFGNFPAWPTFGGGTFSPRIDVTEDDERYVVSAELPGMNEKEVEITVSNGALTIKGEKRQEREEKSRGQYLVERSYGLFHRSLPLPSDIVEEQIEASFRNGVLTVRLPKSREARPGSRRIDVKAE